MPAILSRIQKAEFEARIFVSFGLVILISIFSFGFFAGTPANAVFLGRALGLTDESASSLGFVAAAALMAAASFLRIWSGSVLTSGRMMSFRVRVDKLCFSGPYLVVRNPIYLADLIGFAGFALCLPPPGIVLPVLIFGHYTQLIGYEEKSLLNEFGPEYADYRRRTPSLLPTARSLLLLPPALREFKINRDGLRHNALYLLFIPGFLIAAATDRLLWAVLLGVPAVVDWAVVHTRIGTAKDEAGAAEGKRPRKVFRDILYANCWEDPALDREAFQITPDDVVFSITSGGCNVLTFLLDNPRKIIALDLNPHQNYLLELKIAALRHLSHERLLEFSGVRPSASRLRDYRKVRACLSPEAAAFWDRRLDKIAAGLIHCGRYEGYMRLLRKAVVSFPLKKRLVREFYENEDPAARRCLFQEKWQGPAWRFLTSVLLSRRLNSLLFDRRFFAYLDADFSFGRHFAAKAERALTQLPLRENYFLSYILLGRPVDEEHLPHYLRKENSELIRSRLDRIEIVTSSCESFFARLPDSSISKFNFSNIFEWMPPPDFEALLRETVRVARDGAVLTYRNLLVFRERPASLQAQILSCRELADSLRAKDLSFIYDNYVVERIRKEETG
jgi:S-adenosylmethionine-diacylglycerol 3-amino-3-carboxypropyl transferase